ncbi:MAG TPA: hypothetical protein VEY88_13370, partial [Archangium sp.]|nr:hypothetical protein [Archangium sp.]
RITGFLLNELNAPKHLNGDQVLNAIEIQQGLIVQRAQDVWSFSHLTLQEYLTAVWYESTQQTNALIREKLFDVRWREVFILLVGAADKADDLLQLMLRTAEKRLAKSPWAVQFTHWSSNRVASADVEQALTRRSFAITLALSLIFVIERSHASTRTTHTALRTHFSSSIDRAHAILRTLTHPIDSEHAHPWNHSLIRVYDRSLVSNLDLVLGPNLVLSFAQDSHRNLIGEYVDNLVTLLAEIDSSQLLSGAWIETIKQLNTIREQLRTDVPFEDFLKAWNQTLDIIINAFQLPTGMITLERGGDTLDSYLYACQLILDCKNAATRISRTAWEDICRRMFNPPKGRL